MFTGVSSDAVALLSNAKSVYEVPLTLERFGIADVVIDRLNLKRRVKKPDFKAWKWVVNQATKRYDQPLRIGVVAKYMANVDTYMSVFEALKSAAFKHDVGLEIHWIDAEKLESKRANIAKSFERVDGIVVPGGFGKRAIEGKVKAAQYALSSQTPYLGLCLGLQVAVVAAARNQGLATANTVEVDEDTPDAIVDVMPGQQSLLGTGGSMRLGNYPCVLRSGTKAHRLYGVKQVEERHRHRYEVNNAYRDVLEAEGLVLSGLSPDGQLVEVIEHATHPFFMACQFHPELRSRPNRPHPLFDGFVASLKKRQR
jgi:CTP synthase